MHWLSACVLCLSVGSIVCPPVTQPPPGKPKPGDEKKLEEDVNFGLEYERYLKEVVNILETDEKFKEKLESANVTDIKSGAIAQHLDLVSHHVRSKLDELKRGEIERLRQLVRIKMRQAQESPEKFGLKNFDPRKMLSHLDHGNPNSFEMNDLAKLIKQATTDLEEIDIKRKEEFKEYELTKEHLRRERLKKLNEADRAKEQQEFEELKKKHKDHPKLHHPGSRDQLEEVWEENDGYDKEDFDPKAFFQLHDIDGDRFLNENELESMFQAELDKVYNEDAKEDDMVERYEEMNRMREHVMNEVDRDGDKLISLEEFLDSTKQEDFEKDEGWDTLDEQEMFTDEELKQFEEEYERRRLEEYDGQVPPGVVNPPFDPSAMPPVEDSPGVQHMNQGHPQQVPPVPERVPDPQHQQQQPSQDNLQFVDQNHINVQQQQAQQDQQQQQQQQQQQMAQQAQQQQQLPGQELHQGQGDAPQGQQVQGHAPQGQQDQGQGHAPQGQQDQGQGPSIKNFEEHKDMPPI